MPYGNGKKIVQYTGLTTESRETLSGAQECSVLAQTCPASSSLRVAHTLTQGQGPLPTRPDCESKGIRELWEQIRESLGKGVQYWNICRKQVSDQCMKVPFPLVTKKLITPPIMNRLITRVYGKKKNIASRFFHPSESYLLIENR